MTTPVLAGQSHYAEYGSIAVIIVLTDGYTPWPAEPPPGSRVIVGLLVEGGGPGITELAGPDWARTILIDEP